MQKRCIPDLSECTILCLYLKKLSEGGPWNPRLLSHGGDGVRRHRSSYTLGLVTTPF